MTIREILEEQVEDEIIEEGVEINTSDILTFLNVLDKKLDARLVAQTGLIIKQTKTYHEIAKECLEKYTKRANFSSRINSIAMKTKSAHINRFSVENGVFFIYIDVFGNDKMIKYKKEYDKDVIKFFKILQMSANRFRKIIKKDLSSIGDEYNKKFTLNVVYYGKSGPDGLTKDESERLHDYIAKTLTDIVTV